MKKLHLIQNEIKKGNFEKAFEIALEESENNKFILFLLGQYKNWKNRFDLGVTKELEERNRIVNAFLDFLTESSESNKKQKNLFWFTKRFIFTFLLISTAVLLYFYFQNQAITKEKNVIEQFYTSLSKGITGIDIGTEDSYFKKAYNSLSSNRQSRFENFYPNETPYLKFGQLYKHSGSHTVISSAKRNIETSNQYYVLLRIEEYVPKNPLYYKFKYHNSISPLNTMEDEEFAINSILTALKENYEFDSNPSSKFSVEMEINNFLRSNQCKIKDALGIRFIKELGYKFESLTPKRGNFMPVNIIELVSITVVYNDGEPKIDKFSKLLTSEIN